jgi:hypothetical protein
MKQFLLIVLLILQNACSQENTALNSGAPNVSEPCENPLVEGEEIGKKNAKPLTSACVDGLFQRVAQACEAQDGEMLLAQITPKYQKIILSRKPESASVFERASYICDNLKQIREEFLEISPDPSYGIFRSGQSARLCIYTQDRSHCEGELKVAFEDKKLRLNTH